MDSLLPTTGTAELLDLLSPYVPNDFINERWPTGRTGGRRRICNSAQLFRTHLLNALTPVHSLNLLVEMLPEQPAWRKFAQIRNVARTPDVRMLHEFRLRVGVSGMREINQHLLEPMIEVYAAADRSLALIDATDLPAACGGFKKKHRCLLRAARRTGRTHAQDRAEPVVCRLQKAHPAPVAASISDRLISWVAPANVHEGGFLVPSLRYCQRRWQWCPSLIVADMGYLSAEAKRQSRELWHVAVLTKLRSDMKLVPPYVAWNQMACPQGEPVEWLGYDHRADEHWFGVGEQPQLCASCWEAARCPKQFSFHPTEHETLLGRLPLGTQSAQNLLRRARPWIEPAQSFEKNQLGLSAMFLNSLRLTWMMSLLADAAVLLRAKVLIEKPTARTFLANLLPEQIQLEF